MALARSFLIAVFLLFSCTNKQCELDALDYRLALQNIKMEVIDRISEKTFNGADDLIKIHRAVLNNQERALTDCRIARSEKQKNQRDEDELEELMRKIIRQQKEAVRELSERNTEASRSAIPKIQERIQRLEIFQEKWTAAAR